MCIAEITLCTIVICWIGCKLYGMRTWTYSDKLFWSITEPILNKTAKDRVPWWMGPIMETIKRVGARTRNRFCFRMFPGPVTLVVPLLALISNSSNNFEHSLPLPSAVFPECEAYYLWGTMIRYYCHGLKCSRFLEFGKIYASVLVQKTVSELPAGCVMSRHFDYLGLLCQGSVWNKE